MNIKCIMWIYGNIPIYIINYVIYVLYDIKTNLFHSKKLPVDKLEYHKLSISTTQSSSKYDAVILSQTDRSIEVSGVVLHVREHWQKEAYLSQNI